MYNEIGTDSMGIKIDICKGCKYYRYKDNSTDTGFAGDTCDVRLCEGDLSGNWWIHEGEWIPKKCLYKLEHTVMGCSEEEESDFAPAGYRQ